eukprot:CAMPEP_0168598974 /NCGR_PEP_ID=MMETSP0420-20121227/11773_1 /TAXON_ID=498008 /ORGANISM="Pessonella sp." /LENGTH=516 /DNA_ID=CAMNT_0008636507 /DNA_START=999 /DNA_END=2545 /DNA_ORIENTATION=+
MPTTTTTIVNNTTQTQPTTTTTETNTKTTTTTTTTTTQTATVTQAVDNDINDQWFFQRWFAAPQIARVDDDGDSVPDELDVALYPDELADSFLPPDNAALRPNAARIAWLKAVRGAGRVQPAAHSIPTEDFERVDDDGDVSLADLAEERRLMRLAVEQSRAHEQRKRKLYETVYTAWAQDLIDQVRSSLFETCDVRTTTAVESCNPNTQSICEAWALRTGGLPVTSVGCLCQPGYFGSFCETAPSTSTSTLTTTSLTTSSLTSSTLTPTHTSSHVTTAHSTPVTTSSMMTSSSSPKTLIPTHATGNGTAPNLACPNGCSGNGLCVMTTKKCNCNLLSGTTLKFEAPDCSLKPCDDTHKCQVGENCIREGNPTGVCRLSCVVDASCNAGLRAHCFQPDNSATSFCKCVDGFAGLHCDVEVPKHTTISTTMTHTSSNTSNHSNTHSSSSTSDTTVSAPFVSTTPRTTTHTDVVSNSGSQPADTKTAKIVLIVVGCVILVGFVIGVALYFMRRRKRMTG